MAKKHKHDESKKGESKKVDSKQDKSKHDKSKHGKSKHDKSKHDKSKHDESKPGKSKPDESKLDDPIHDKPKHVRAEVISSAKKLEKMKDKERAEAKETKKSDLLHPLETVTNILLIRHGHTEATELGLLYSDAKMPLTTKGIAQSKAAAKLALNFKPDVIVTGSAVRVAQAAAPLAQTTGLKPVVVKGFEEWHVGTWEGRTYLDIKKNDPKQYAQWSADPVNNAPPGGESIDDLVQRIGKSLRHLILNEEFNGKNIAMVTHSGIIRSIIVQALDMPVSNFWRIAVPTGSLSRVNFSKNFATLQFSGLLPDSKP